jgi:hypothetical protein
VTDRLTDSPPLSACVLARLQSTLTLLTRNPTARPPPLPLPPPSSSAAAAPASLLVPSPADEIIIPRTLLPILTHLREHSLSLAAENRELRQLLVASSDAVADEAVIRVPKTEGPSSGSRDQKGRKVNLSKVVDRLRALTEENRELGTVVDALGREVGEARALKAALDGAFRFLAARQGLLLIPATRLGPIQKHTRRSWPLSASLLPGLEGLRKLMSRALSLLQLRPRGLLWPDRGPPRHTRLVRGHLRQPACCGHSPVDLGRVDRRARALV